MEPVAVYRRTIGASLARVWENVLDWEHLPWLHASSFLGVELVSRDTDGWRAWVTTASRERSLRSLVDVRVHRAELHYWTRTIEGAGVGSDIRTTLVRQSPRATEIFVEFFVPDGERKSSGVGESYTRLYARLWDEDEAMMVRRQQTLDEVERAETAPDGPLNLGAVGELRSRLPLVIGRVRVIEVDGEIIAHSTLCPHLGGPLEFQKVCDGVITCPWHGYRYDVRSGTAVDGHQLCLAPAPSIEVDETGIAWLASKRTSIEKNED